MTAVIRRAEAVRQAVINMRSSMRWLSTLSIPVWMIKTSSSRTDSPDVGIIQGDLPISILVSPLGVFDTMALPSSTPSLYISFGIERDISWQPVQQARDGYYRQTLSSNFSAFGWRKFRCRV